LATGSQGFCDAIELEVVSGRKAAILIEMIVDGSMDRRELLQGSHSPEAKHRPFGLRKG
jgi:hypothetical protein